MTLYNQFLFILPEIFVLFSSLYFLVLGLFSFVYFSGSYDTSGSLFFVWGRNNTYSVELGRSSLESYRSFFFILFLSVFFLCFILFDTLYSSSSLFSIVFYGSYDVSYFTTFGKFLVAFSFFCYLLVLYIYYNGRIGLKFYSFSMTFEAFFLMFLALIASIFIVSSANFLMFYLSLELQTLILYILVSMNRTSATSTEGGLKYLILGALSTGLLLFGISVFYGTSSLLNFFEISLFLSLIKYSSASYIFELVVVSLLFISFSFFFKFSIFPFHLWTPDVYEGAPTPIMIFIAVFGKFSVLLFLIKLFVLMDLSNNLFSISTGSIYIIDIFLFFSFLTVLIGSVGGLLQSKIKRLWGYSAIANLGFVFLGLSTFSILGFSASMLYLLFYTLLNFLFFAVYSSLKFRTGAIWSDLRYLAQLGYAKIMDKVSFYVICFVLISFLSFPPFLNFIMKVYVLWSVYYDLTYPSVYIIVSFLLINLIGSFYYLRLYRFSVSQVTGDYFYAPIFYKSINFSSYFIIFMFLVLYFLCLIYNNTIFSFLNVVFSSYCSSDIIPYESLDSLKSEYNSLKDIF